MKKIDWDGVGEWIVVDGQIYVLFGAIIVMIVGMVVFGWHPEGDD